MSTAHDTIPSPPPDTDDDPTEPISREQLDEAIQLCERASERASKVSKSQQLRAVKP